MKINTNAKQNTVNCQASYRKRPNNYEFYLKLSKIDPNKLKFIFRLTLIS